MWLFLIKKMQKKRGPDFRSPLDSCEVWLHLHDNPEAPAGIHTTVGAGAHGTACDGGVYGTSAHTVGRPHARGDGSAAAGGHHRGGGCTEHCVDPL